MANYNNSTITISGSSGISQGLVNGAFSQQNLSTVNIFDELNDTTVKKYQVYETQEDLLVLSATWKRLRDNTAKGAPYINIEKLFDKNLFTHITEDDREMAASIRDYYSKKIMVWKLKGQRLTKFREDMNEFIHSNGKVFKEEMCPLVYRLPEFYEYDTQFDQMAGDHNKLIKERPATRLTKNLKLQKTFMVGKRYTKRKEYWFTDDNDNLVTLSLVKDNPLLSLLDLHTQTPITMTAKFDIRERDNTQYMVADKYTFS